MSHSTITNNVADDDGDGIGTGGGFLASSGAATLDHTLVVGNIDRSGNAPDVAGIINARHSLVGFGAEYLGPLGNNGGPTMTHALLPGSPAIDAGDPSAQAGADSVPVHDQRGAPFTRVYGGRIDVGAVEAQPVDVLAGDYNGNRVVDAADYSRWRDTLGHSVAGGSGADGNGDGMVDEQDYRLWVANFGATTADLPMPAPVAAAGVEREQPPFSTTFALSQAQGRRMGTDPAAEPVTPVALVPASVERALAEWRPDASIRSRLANQPAIRPTNRVAATVADTLLLLLARSSESFLERSGVAAVAQSPAGDEDAPGDEPSDVFVELDAALANVAR